MATPSKTPPGADPKQLERTGTVREIGSQAVWSLSSCKPGFGVDQLRDDNLETYWQSDGSQPHLVNIQFRRRTTVKMLCIYADYKSDESYTPSKISVRVGNNFHNLQEVRVGRLRRAGARLRQRRPPNAALLFFSAAAGDGGAQRLDSHLPDEPADQRANQHLHDPDRRAGQSPERQRHAHAADQSVHAGGGELHRKVPTMHHGGLHDVPQHQVTPDPGPGPGPIHPFYNDQESFGAFWCLILKLT
ncbi:anaphase-promoting complex subunit 10 isoform X1 [Brachionichthys hirsutus]|uniref:anaphase-promoting complex subunit 10 isoform X1 n=1 Tax=Brachionichthys hirsutus TaxID=412623 RepID=UPI003604630F